MCCICKCAVAIIGLILKICIWVFNIFFFIAGCCLFSYGIYLAAEDVTGEYSVLFDDFGSEMWDATIGLMITLGLFIICVGVLGCCGGCKDSRCLWFLYICLMGVILCIQITMVSLAATQQTEIQKYMDNNFPNQIKYDYGVDSEMTKAWDALQIDRACCGANSYLDYRDSNYTESQPEVTVQPPMSGVTFPPGLVKYNVPESCCVQKNGAIDRLSMCMREAAEPDEYVKYFVNTRGCTGELMKYVDETGTAIYATMFVVAIFVCLSMVMGFCKCCGVDKDDDNPT